MTEEMIVCDGADCTNVFSYSPPEHWVRFELSKGRGRPPVEGFMCPYCWYKRTPVDMAKRFPELLQAQPAKQHNEKELAEAWDKRWNPRHA